MKRATLVVIPALLNNRAFDLAGSHNRDNCLLPFAILKEKLAARGYALATQDIHPSTQSDLIIHNDLTGPVPPLSEKHKHFLIVYESPIIAPQTHNPKNQKHFAKVFTWADDKVSGETVIRLKYGLPWPQTITTTLADKTHFACTISSNKSSPDPTELYSARRKTIRWYEKNHPDQFDLYGIGWDKKTFTGLLRPLNRCAWAKKTFAPHYPSWKGLVKNKEETLKKYRFAFAYENNFGTTGYITEKIFDVLFSGTVPVYWGAPNITDYMPADCFIHQPDFSSQEALHAFMANMGDAAYAGYLERIKAYIESNQTGPFAATTWAETIAAEAASFHL